MKNKENIVYLPVKSKELNLLKQENISKRDFYSIVDKLIQSANINELADLLKNQNHLLSYYLCNTKIKALASKLDIDALTKFTRKLIKLKLSKFLLDFISHIITLNKKIPSDDIKQFFTELIETAVNENDETIIKGLIKKGNINQLSDLKPDIMHCLLNTIYQKENKNLLKIATRHASKDENNKLFQAIAIKAAVEQKDHMLDIILNGYFDRKFALFALELMDKNNYNDTLIRYIKIHKSIIDEKNYLKILFKAVSQGNNAMVLYLLSKHYNNRTSKYTAIMKKAYHLAWLVAKSKNYSALLEDIQNKYPNNIMLKTSGEIDKVIMTLRGLEVLSCSNTEDLALHACYQTTKKKGKKRAINEVKEEKTLWPFKYHCSELIQSSTLPTKSEHILDKCDIANISANITNEERRLVSEFLI